MITKLYIILLRNITRSCSHQQSLALGVFINLKVILLLPAPNSSLHVCSVHDFVELFLIQSSLHLLRIAGVHLLLTEQQLHDLPSLDALHGGLEVLGSTLELILV